MEQSNLDDALEIAKNLRKTILEDVGTIGSQLLSFYTISQILGKKENMKWAETELGGYKKGIEVPNYRKSVFANISLGNKLEKTTSSAIMFESILKLDELKKTKKDLITFAVAGENVSVVEKTLGHKIEPDNYTFDIPKEDFSKLVGYIRFELLKRLNEMIGEIVYGKIPQNVFQHYQNKVNEKLSQSNPNAISELNIAYESLGNSEDPERISHVAFACRRLIKAIADQLFPAQQNVYHLKDGKEIDVGEEKFLNRLSAYVDSVNSPNRKFLIRKIDLLRDLYGEIPESINKGTHLTITNKDAESLVLYSYIILGDLLLEQKIS